MALRNLSKATYRNLYDSALNYGVTIPFNGHWGKLSESEQLCALMIDLAMLDYKRSTGHYGWKDVLRQVRGLRPYDENRYLFPQNAHGKNDKI